MGNSEVGHLNLGAGRVVYQEYTRINRAITTGTFFTNKTLTDAIDLALKTGNAVHVMGLLSPGGVHSHEEHIHAIMELAAKRGVTRLYLHAFLDGRDTPPQSATSSIKAVEDKFKSLGHGRFASVIGRHYAMDRDHRWPRIQAAYDLMTQGQGLFTAPTASAALTMAYGRGETDEFVKATAIVPDQGCPNAASAGGARRCRRGKAGAVRGRRRADLHEFPLRPARQITRPFTDRNFQRLRARGRAEAPARS